MSQRKFYNSLQDLKHEVRAKRLHDLEALLSNDNATDTEFLGILHEVETNAQELGHDSIVNKARQVRRRMDLLVA